MKVLNEKIIILLEQLDFDVKISDSALELLDEVEAVDYLDNELILKLIQEYSNHFPLIDNDLTNDTELQYFFYMALDMLRFENSIIPKTEEYQKKSGGYSLDVNMDDEEIEKLLKVNMDDEDIEELLIELENKLLTHVTTKQEFDDEINKLINIILTN